MPDLMNLPASVSLRQHPGGLAFIEVDHPLARASLCLQGAHLTHYQASGQLPLLWVSDAEDYQPGKAIRGGIPICWPWFGPHPAGQGPAHGLVRDRNWQLEQARESADGVELVLSVLQGPVAVWPHAARLELTLHIGRSLRLQLVSENTGTQAFDLTQALHAYFPVGAIDQTRVRGLGQWRYRDSLRPEIGLQTELSDRLEVRAETDRIYYGVGTIGLETPDQRLEILSQGAGSLVLWNPWIDKSRRLSNFRDDDYLHMLCIETANCGDDVIRLKPGQQHRLSVEYRYAGKI